MSNGVVKDSVTENISEDSKCTVALNLSCRHSCEFGSMVLSIITRDLAYFRPNLLLLI